MDIRPVTTTPEHFQTVSAPVPVETHVNPADQVSLSDPEGKTKPFFSLDKLKLKQSKIESDAETVFGKKASFVNDYMDSRQVENKVLELFDKYPDLVSVACRIFRTEGYDGKNPDLQGPAPLNFVKISDMSTGDEGKVGVLITASPHAREMMNPLITLETMQYLLENFDPASTDSTKKEITELLKKVNIYFVPVSNPDGLNFALYDDPNWRKTRSTIPGSTEKGVDTNRNYDYQWEPSDPASQTYSGTHPFSEPETRHVAELIEEHPEIKFVCDFHSQGEEVRRPLGVVDENDLRVFKQLQDRMATGIRTNRGKEYEKVESNVVNGASDDYFYFKKGLFALVVEDGKQHKPPLEEALRVVKEVAGGALELIKYASEWQAQKHKIKMEAKKKDS